MDNIYQINVNGTDYDVGPKEVNDFSDANLNIVDEQYNVLAELKEGHLRTKNFDSRKICAYEKKYVGKKIDLQQRTYDIVSFKTFQGMALHQSMAIYGKYLVTCNDNEIDTASAQVFNIETGELIGEVVLEHGNYSRPHCNVCCFGTEFAPGNTTLPLLYISQWSYASERGVIAYNIVINGSSVTFERKQVIIPMDIPTNILGSGSCDWVLDEKGYVWAFAYYLSGSSSIVDGNKEMIAKFKLPTLSQGAEVMLTESDVLEHFELEMMNVSQDKKYLNGKVYILSGPPGATTFRSLRVVDMAKQKIITRLDLNWMTGEPEGLAFYQGKFLFSKGRNELFQIKV